MTSMPASRSALATTRAPRSWPSSPGLAISTRILRDVPAAFITNVSPPRSIRSTAPRTARPLEHRRLPVRAELGLQRLHRFAHGDVRVRTLEEVRHQVLLLPRRRTERTQGALG